MNRFKIPLTLGNISKYGLILGQAPINNIGVGHENDDIGSVNTDSLPPVNTPVRVTLRLEGGKPKD